MLPESDGVEITNVFSFMMQCFLRILLFGENKTTWVNGKVKHYLHVNLSALWIKKICDDKSHKKWTTDTYIISTCKYHASGITLSFTPSLTHPADLHWLIFNQTLLISRQTFHWERITRTCLIKSRLILLCNFLRVQNVNEYIMCTGSW